MKRIAEGILLARIQNINWVLLIIFTLVVWGAFSSRTSYSVFIGGALTTFSFYWLKKDIHQLLNGEIRGVKLLFFVKYYARLAALAIILYILIKREFVDIFGLLAGLSTIVASIIIAAIGMTREKNFT